MVVDPIPELALKKAQAVALRKIKKWLNLPRCFTTSALHHPNVIDIPCLSDLRSKAKLTFLSAISTSKDPFIEELQKILTNEGYCKSQQIQAPTVDLLLKAKASISTISSKMLNNHCRSERRREVSKKCDERLKELTVQNKILEAAELESSNPVWKRILQGLPAG